MMTKRVVVILMWVCLVALTQADVLIYDSFGRTGPLHGSSPDVGSNTWLADSTFMNTDGSVLNMSADPSSDWSDGRVGLLPVTIESGNVYTLSVEVDVVATDWACLGFATNVSVYEGDQQFPGAANAGPWMLLKSGESLQSFGGLGTDNGSGDVYAADLGVDLSGVVLLTIILNTTDASWTWETYAQGVLVQSGTYTTNPEIVGVGVGVFDWDGGQGAGIVASVDEFTLACGAAGKAQFPTPSDGDTLVYPSLDELNWVNPDPNNPNDTIACDVYFEADDGDANDISLVVTGLAAESITLGTYGITLDPLTKYYWRVDVTDPNSGGPITTEGDIWAFTTINDIAPEVEADAAGTASSDGYIHIWLDPVDPSNTIIVLDGTVIDDEQSALTTTWTIIAQDPAEASVVIDDPSAVDTFVTVNSTGYYQFQLTAEDALWTDSDSVTFIVHTTACEAAYNDPDDILATHPANGLSGRVIGDIDGDCDVDLEDFSVLAVDWLDCISDKLDCNL